MIFFFKKRRYLILTLFFLGLGAFLTIRFFGTTRPKKEETAIITRTTLEEKLIISGSLEAEEKTTLRFEKGGYMNWVGVKEGERVKKYQVVATLDRQRLQKELEKELNDYLTSRSNFDDAKKDTYKDKALTDPIKRIIDRAQFDLNKSVLDVEIQNLALTYSRLWTPISGIITRVTSPYAGVNIIPTQAEFDVVNPETIYFLAIADQTEVVKLREGQIGELTLDAYPQATFSGHIKTISLTPKTDETGTVYGVKFSFEGDTSSLRIGMAGDVSFITKQRENVLVVPARFVKTENEAKYLVVGRNGKKEKIPVQTGIGETLIEITRGVVTAGETVYD